MGTVMLCAISGLVWRYIWELVKYKKKMKSMKRIKGLINN